MGLLGTFFGFQIGTVITAIIVSNGLKNLSNPEYVANTLEDVIREAQQNAMSRANPNAATPNQQLPPRIGRIPQAVEQKQGSGSYGESRDQNNNVQFVNEPPGNSADFAKENNTPDESNFGKLKFNPPSVIYIYILYLINKMKKN